MPGSKIITNGKGEDSQAAKRTDTFTGNVWSQMVIAADNSAVANVLFTPCSRSYWHTHEGGQMLYVTVGSGWVCDKGGGPRRIKAGDVVWAEPGTTHWHGADKDSFMSHLAVGRGKTTWHEEVVDDIYKE